MPHFYKIWMNPKVFSSESLRDVLTYYINNLDDLKAIINDIHRYDLKAQQVEEITLFETKTDSVVKTVNLRLQKHPEFFNEIGQLLKDYQLNNLLSIAVLKQNSLVAEEEQNYMEVSSEKENRSIIQLLKRENTPQNSIRISWSFKSSKQHTCWYEYDR
ncbi:hypothetical protein IM40_08520 [Candidatus Paracaedimonas acanthamoebae]|nr:hypothetical protein IM40_08520 [Candidatus Paracaedimonas acanthamoebae]